MNGKIVKVSGLTNGNKYCEAQKDADGAREIARPSSLEAKNEMMGRVRVEFGKEIYKGER